MKKVKIQYNFKDINFDNAQEHKDYINAIKITEFTFLYAKAVKNTIKRKHKIKIQRGKRK